MIILDGRFIGYEFYNGINYSIYFSSIGDCMDRYLLRINEIIESCRIIYVMLFILLNSFTYNCYSFSYSIMELLINDFLLNFPLIQVIIKSLKLTIESSKGIYSIVIAPFPFLTINIIANDFLTLNEINNFIKYIKLFVYTLPF